MDLRIKNTSVFGSMYEMAKDMARIVERKDCAGFLVGDLAIDIVHLARVMDDYKQFLWYVRDGGTYLQDMDDFDGSLVCNCDVYVITIDFHEGLYTIEEIAHPRKRVIKIEVIE